MNFHTHTYIYTYVHTNTHTYIHIHTHIHTYIHTYTHTYTYTRLHTHTHTHTHTQTHTHTNIHTYKLRKLVLNKIYTTMKTIFIISCAFSHFKTFFALTSISKNTSRAKRRRYLVYIINIWKRDISLTSARNSVET